MTYAGLKSMIYAGVKADDPHVKAAVGWVKKHYTVDANPGMPVGEQGLYYYYNTMSKALAAMGVDQITDDEGRDAQLAARSDHRAGQAAKDRTARGSTPPPLAGRRIRTW